MARQTTDHCPHADNCWKGGGSYRCMYNPPFCKKPLLPKNNNDWQKLELPRPRKEAEENKGGDFMDGNDVMQGELF